MYDKAVKRSECGVEFMLMAPTGFQMWAVAKPNSRLKRFFPDKMLVQEPGRATQMWRLLGTRVKKKRPAFDESF